MTGPSAVRSFVRLVQKTLVSQIVANESVLYMWCLQTIWTKKINRYTIDVKPNMRVVECCCSIQFALKCLQFRHPKEKCSQHPIESDSFRSSLCFTSSQFRIVAKLPFGLHYGSIFYSKYSQCQIASGSFRFFKCFTLSVHTPKLWQSCLSGHTTVTNKLTQENAGSDTDVAKAELNYFRHLRLTFGHEACEIRRQRFLACKISNVLAC